MTAPQAPTPGVPLSAESVKLLKAGDVLRCTNPHTRAHIAGQTYVFDRLTHNSPGEGNDVVIQGDQLSTWSGIFTFIGRPDAEGWMTWSGSENPVPGLEVEWRNRDGDSARVLSDDLCGWDWVNDPNPNIIAFRLTTPSDQGGACANCGSVRGPSEQCDCSLAGLGDPVWTSLSTTTPTSGSDGLETVEVHQVKDKFGKWVLCPLVTREAAEKRIGELTHTAKLLAKTAENAIQQGFDHIERASAAESQVAALKAALEDLLTEAEDVFVCMADATGIDRHNLPTAFKDARQALALKEGR